MGNEKISITAEMVALIKYKRGDKFSRYFVTKRVKNLYKFLSFVFPKKAFEDVFNQRILLSKEFESMIKKYNPEQIIEIGSGFSLLGFGVVQNSNINYVETDFDFVIDKKKAIIDEIRKKENVLSYGTHKFVSVDVLRNNLFDKVKSEVDLNKKTLIVAEGLTSYFDLEEHDFLIDNVSDCLKHFKCGAFLAHEIFKENRSNERFFVKILHKIAKLISKSKTYSHFSSVYDMNDYFKKKGIEKISFSKNSKLKTKVYLFEMV